MRAWTSVPCGGVTSLKAGSSAFDRDGVLVDVGSKSEGILPFGEMNWPWGRPADKLHIGDATIACLWSNRKPPRARCCCRSIAPRASAAGASCRTSATTKAEASKPR